MALVFGAKFRQRLELFGAFHYHARLNFQGLPVAFAGAKFVGFVTPGWETATGSFRGFVAAVLLATSAFGLVAVPAQARPAAHEGGNAAVVALTALPAEAQRTETLIRRGGPFAHAKDGAVFVNRERRLPRENRGYYREYTVKTPGAADRGARRIVCGGRDKLAPDACYYTADHYTSFKRIVQ